MVQDLCAQRLPRCILVDVLDTDFLNRRDVYRREFHVHICLSRREIRFDDFHAR